MVKTVSLYCYLKLVLFQLPIVTRTNYTLLIEKYLDIFINVAIYQYIRLALNDYIKNSTENYLKEVAKEEILKVQETKKEYHKQEINTRKERWQGKALHGQYLKDIEGKVDCDNT